MGTHFSSHNSVFKNREGRVKYDVVYSSQRHFYEPSPQYKGIDCYFKARALESVLSASSCQWRGGLEGWEGRDRGAPSTHARPPNWARLAEPALRFLRLATRFLCGKVCFSEMRCFMCELDSRGVETLCGTFVGNRKKRSKENTIMCCTIDWWYPVFVLPLITAVAPFTCGRSRVGAFELSKTPAGFCCQVQKFKTLDSWFFNIKRLTVKYAY